MNDLEFVQRCAKGDKQAWDEFVTRYSHLIFNYIYRVLKSNNSNQSLSENIKDIFQEIFVSLSKDNFRKLKSFKARNGCSLASWLRQVAVNAAIDYARKSRYVISIDEENEDGLSLKEVLASHADSASDQLAAKEKLGQLKDCIKAMDIEDKYFLELHINQKLSLESLRGLLKISRGAVDMRKARIINRLRECFRSKGFDI
jgi:RNA polymerase sigma factor (sigma-70 family)